jgi:hypothetical protein
MNGWCKVGKIEATKGMIERGEGTRGKERRPSDMLLKEQFRGNNPGSLVVV